MVYVPKGMYKSGLYFEPDSISYDFWIGKYEITNEQYYQFIIDALSTKYIFMQNNNLYFNFKGNKLIPKNNYKIKLFDDRIYFKNDSIILNSEYKNHPVISVTWYGAKAFCEYYGFDLPYENEWEKAARGNNKFWFPWGNVIDSSYANYYNSKDPYEPMTTPVGFYNGKKTNDFQTSNAISTYGCYDMSGNAWEWINDYWTKTTPYNKGKGGGFVYHTPAFLQVYSLSTFGPEEPPELDRCDKPDGFRVVKRNK